MTKSVFLRCRSNHHGHPQRKSRDPPRRFQGNLHPSTTLGMTGTLRPAFAVSRLFASVDINKRNHCAIDSVIGCAIRSDAKRVVATFQVLHFPLNHFQSLDHFAKNTPAEMCLSLQ